MQFAATASEEAQKINDQTGTNRYGMSLITDQDFWEKQGIITGEDLAISILNQSYSDMHKSIHGFRPRHKAFTTVIEAQDAINELDDSYEALVAQEEIEAKQQAEFERERLELEELMPGEFDFEQYPTQTGMGRRMENKVQISRKQLREIIAEVMTVDPPVHQDEPAEVYGHGGTARHSKQQLFNVATLSQSLHDRLNDDDELPEWVQSNLAVIEAKLLDVAAHLEYKIHRKDAGQ